jgi:hypothetical protein
MKVEVKSYYMVGNDVTSWGGYDSYEEALEYAKRAKRERPWAKVSILHETTVTTELEEIGVDDPWI